MVKDVWWDNVIFREFAAHFISMSDEQVVRDIRESVVKVINLDESGDSFGANMVRRAKERLCGRHDIAVQNGKQGGRPRKEEPGAVAIDSSKGKKSAQAGSHKTGNAIAPIPAAAPAEPVVMNLAYSGEFGNVRLTQQEYSELGIRFANKCALDRAIDSLSCQIENGEKNPKSHYAELVKWASYRDDKAEERKAEQEAKAVAKNTMSFQEVEGQRQVAQLRKYGLIK